MSFSGVGSLIQATATTFTLVPNTVGDFIVIFVASSGSAATALSSSNVTWSVLVAGTLVGSEEITAFLGKVTSTSSATVTVTVSGSPTLRIGGHEGSNTAGFSAITLDTHGQLNATGTAWPSLTPGHGAGEFYIGYEFNGGTATAGSTSGYTYNIDSNGNGLAFDPSCPNSATSPVWGDSDARSVMAVLLYEASTTVALTTPNVALAAPLVTPSASAAVALTAPNVALAAPVVSVATGKSVALTTPNVALAAPLLTPSAGGTVALTAPNVALAAPLVTPPVPAPPPVFPDPRAQLGVRLELFAGGTWVNVTSDLDHGPMQIGRGHPDESTTVSPSTFSAQLTNTAARYSPDNPVSDLWPSVLQNMPGRASIPAASNYLRLEGSGGDRAYVNDDANLHVTGSIEVRIGLRLSDWQGCVLAARLDNSTPSWYWQLNGDGTMTFSYYDSGGTLRSGSSDAPLPFLSGDFALRVTLNASNGTLAFYSAPSIDGTYTQLGDAVAMTGGALTSIRAGNAPLVAGWSINIAGSQLYGRIYEARLYNGIAGTVVADGIFSAQAAGTTSWTDSAGNTWNTAGSAVVTDRNYRTHFESSEWPQDEPVYNPDSANNTSVEVDALVPLVGGGLLRRLGQRAPNVSSAMYRAILAQTGSFAPVAYWPMEDLPGATQFGSAVNGVPMTWTDGTPVLATSSAFTCSGALPALGGAALHGPVPFYGGSGSAWTVRFLAEIPSLPASNQALMQVNVTGGVGAYVIMIVNSDGTIALVAYAADGVTVVANTGSFAWTGGLDQPLLWSIEAQPSGGDVQYTLASIAPGSPVALTISATTTASGVAGWVNYALPAPFGGIWTDTIVGHVFVQAAVESLFFFEGALASHVGEPAGQRFARLCAENSITCRTRGNLADTIAMGVQPAGTLTTLLQACADADQGVWSECRQVLGWAYTTRKALYGQVATATVSYTSDHLSPWTTSPTRDDQTIVNDVTVTNDNGASYRLYAAPGQLIPGGRMSTASPANGGVGTYGQTYSVSIQNDGQLPDLAGWKLHIGTTDQARLPGILVDLANQDAAAVYNSVVDLDLGDRLVISNPPRRLGFEPVTQICQAFQETLGYDTLTVQIAGVPELPYEVVTLDAGMHLAPPAAWLSVAVSATATSWSVVADTGSTALWSTNVADYPQSWVIDGERVTVTTVSGISDPQTATVIRSVNGVVKAHAADTPITAWPPPAIGL